MDKPRQKFKQFYHQNDCFAEPSESPIIQDRVCTSLTTHPINPFTSSYDNQARVINNQFPEQSPMTGFVPSLNVIPNVVLNVQNPINHLFPISMNSSNETLNSKVWDVPPPQQMSCNPNIPLNVQLNNSNIQSNPYILPLHNKISPVIMPNINQGQPLNFQYSNQVIPVSSKQNTPRPHSSRFQRRRSFHDSPHQYHQKTQNFSEFNNSLPHQKNFPMYDLRELLSAKKKQKQIYQSDNAQRDPPEPDEDDNRDSRNHNIPLEEGAQSETHSYNEEQVDAGGDWVEEHIFVKDGKIRLHVNNLKMLAKSDMDLYPWYIVVDKDIMLQHLNFLSILCNSDENCCLMVPQKVLVELQESKEDTDRQIANRAKRAVSFLLQYVDGESVVVGDANCDETSTRCDYLLNCCANLIEQNHHVVLISEDEDFKTLKDSSQIPIFNIKDLKQLLSKADLGNVKNNRIKPPLSVNTKLIKIVVTNDLAVKPNTEVIGGANNVAEINPLNIPTQGTANSLSQKSDSSIKYTIRTGFQSDAIENKFNQISNEKSPKLCLKVINESTSSDNNASSTNQNSLKREIRLNRSVSIKKSSNVQETPKKGETKRVRWRRKRNASDSWSNGCAISSESSSNVCVNSRSDQCAPFSLCAPNGTSNDPGKHQKLVSDDSFLSDFSSFKPRSKPYENLETAISENIPNTTSAHSEIGSGCQRTKRIVLKQPQKQTKLRFKVEDQQMEHSLRVMKDEWLSRFLQIMEEMLTQVVLKDEKFLNEVVYELYGGEPWTILESIECVKIKYKDYCDILDAATKLSDMLWRISDSTGRILVKSPSEFMEMYSYSVYLVEAFKSAVGYCEDLYAASQSLSKLLKDIKDPNFNSSENDFIHHNPQEKDRDIKRLPQNPKGKEQSSPVSPSPKKPTTSPDQKIIQLNPQMSPKIKMVSCKLNPELRSPEKSYQEKGTQNMEHPAHSSRDSLSTPDVVRTNTSIISVTGNQNCSTPSPSTDEEAKVESQAFEEKKQEINRIPVERETLDMDQLDYSEYYENESEDSMANDQDSDINDEIDSMKEIDTITSERSLSQFKRNDLNVCSSSENASTIDNTLKCIFSRVIADVKESILHIQTFCEKTATELSSAVYSNKRKCELYKKAQKTQVMLDDLCKYINSIFCRETYETGDNIKALLRKAGVQHADPNGYLLELYRDVIGHFSEKAKILQESVAALIIVIRKKPSS